MADQGRPFRHEDRRGPPDTVPLRRTSGRETV